jgi:hypothetical protein
MKESFFDILCFFGIIFLTWRITLLIKIIIQLIRKPKSLKNKTLEENISEFQFCNFTISVNEKQKIFNS